MVSFFLNEADSDRTMRAAASSANLLIPHTPLDWIRGVSEDGAEPSSGDYGNHRHAALPMFDAEAVHPCSDLVAALHFGVLGRQRIEVRAVAAAEVADADRAVRIGPDFEVAAGEKFVGNADVSFAADDETAR